MTKLVLSTGNVMSAGPSIIRKRGTNRSNLELLNSLRDNFVAAQNDYAPASNGNGNGHGNGNGTANHTITTDVEAWTERQGTSLFVPRIDWSGAGLRDEANQYEITVKLFLLSQSSLEQREQYIREALELVCRELGIETVDLLVVSFPGISFEGNCEYEADKLNSQQGDLESELATWRVLEKLQHRGSVKRLGVAEFGSDKLDAFLRQTTVRPAVDQINLKNCCNVPPPLKKVAEEHSVELNVHTDCTDILPHGTLREILGQGTQGAGVLADAESDTGRGIRGEVVPQWVVRYMAFVRDRGVIENKGYFAGAQLDEI